MSPQEDCHLKCAMVCVVPREYELSDRVSSVSPQEDCHLKCARFPQRGNMCDVVRGSPGRRQYLTRVLSFGVPRRYAI